MSPLMFTLWFTLLHAAAYSVAGMLILRISKDVYEGSQRTMDYLRDMDDPTDRRHVTRAFFPAQLVRGLLMSLVLWPLLGPLGDLGVLSRLFFFGGLAFIYTHLACAAPCPDNIEGFVYMKERYRDRATLVRFQLEMLLYSVLLAVPASVLLF